MARNTKPISAKNTSVTVRLAAVNRGLRKKRTSSIGCSTRRSQATKAVSASTATANAPRIGALVQPSLGASMMPQTSATSPTIESPAPRPVDRQRLRAARVGHEEATGDQRADHDRHVHEEDRSPPEVLEEEATGDGTERDGHARDPGPDADRDGALTRRR